MASGGLDFTGFVAVEPKSDCPHVQVSYFNFKYKNEGHNILVKPAEFLKACTPACFLSS